MIAGNAVHRSKFAEKNRTSVRPAQVHQRAEMSFLIDVRAKMQAGKGAGYACWAQVFNLKQMSEVSVLRKYLVNYAKTKDVFAAYKASVPVCFASTGTE